MLPNYSFDQSIAAVMDLVMERATLRAAEIHAAEAGERRGQPRRRRHRGEGKSA